MTAADSGGPPISSGHPLSLLYPADQDALRVIYGDIDVEDLGAWSSESTHLHGNGPHVGFGVALRNGYAEPRAYGHLPDTDLSDNRALSGTVIWRGALVGFSERQPVMGDARVSVDLAELDGRAIFTNWRAGPLARRRVRPGPARHGLTVICVTTTPCAATPSTGPAAMMVHSPASSLAGPTKGLPARWSAATSPPHSAPHANHRESVHG